jgi:RimJ/RimL family protein N-acetyltransferase
VNGPSLTTERLLIRPLVPTDARAVHAYRTHHDVRRYQGWQPSSLEEVTSFVNRMAGEEFDRVGTWFQLAICLKASRELIGDLGLHFEGPENLQVELGYTINPAHQRRGYCCEAVNCILDYIFRCLKKHRVIATVDAGNLASIAVLTRLKMRQEAHFRRSTYLNGQWGDDVVYAMLREEWERRVERPPGSPPG